MSAVITQEGKYAGCVPKKGAAFVSYVIERCQVDNGFRAALKRADNPATEYQSWEILAGFHVNLEWENQRLPYATIAAAVARSYIQNNGSTPIGQAIAICYQDGNKSDQAKAKLRRLLACDTTPEACRILRPLLTLIASRNGVTLDYASLLEDMLRFHSDISQTHIKARWAQGFYGKPIGGGQDE